MKRLWPGRLYPDPDPVRHRRPGEPERCGHLADPAGRHHHDQRQPEQLPGHHAPKSTRDVSFSLTPSAGFTGGVANITVNSVGTGADTNKAVTGMSTTISVPVSQPDRFELGQLELSDSITLGDSASVTLNLSTRAATPFPTWKPPFPAITWVPTPLCSTSAT